MKPTKGIILLTLLSVLLLSACTSLGLGAEPTPIPTLVLGNISTTENDNSLKETSTPRGTIVASAIVVPAQEAHLAFVTGGKIMKVNVKVGDHLTEGHILVELDSTLAQLNVERAQRTLRELTSPGAIATAEEAVINALETRDNEAQDVISLSYGRASQDLIDEVQAEITLAEDRLDAAEAAYNKVKNRSLENSGRANALLALNKAKTYLNSLRANYQWYISPPSEVDVAKTTSQAVVAEAAYQEAQWYLAALKGEDIPTDAFGSMLTQLEQAQADLAAAQNLLAQTHLIAPISGIVAEVNVIAGEYASPGRILVIVSNMEQMLIKTTDLSERDIIKVEIGNPAIITVEALSEEYEGTVVSISPIADTLGGDVIYEVTISFNEQPTGVLGGMTAEVMIGN